MTEHQNYPEHRLERITATMLAKYGKNALNKAVRAAKFYAGEGDTAQMKLWIGIGERIKAKNTDGHTEEATAESVS